MNQPFSSYGGALNDDEYHIQVHGYIKPELFYDSRRVAALRQGHISLFPLPGAYDYDGRDLNAVPRFHLLPIESRIRLVIDAPPWYNAQLSGLFEVDLTGGSIINNATDHNVGSYSSINVLKARHACIRLDWPCTSVLLGHYFHPFAVDGLPAGFLVAFLGSVCEPYSRNPQIRLTYRFSDHVHVLVAALTQLDFVSNGPDGYSSAYLRRSLVPNLSAQIRFSWCDDQTIGIGFDYKRLIPREQTMIEKNGFSRIFKTRNGVNSFSALIFTHLQYRRLESWIKIIYAENLVDQLMISGYGVIHRDERTGQERYAPLASVGFIVDMHLKYPIEPGIHIGYVKQVGLARASCLFQDPTKSADDPRRFLVYGFGNPDDYPSSHQFNNISSIFILVPRVKWHAKPFTVAAELEYTRALYGTMTVSGDVIRSRPVHVVRGTIAAFYFF